MKKLLFIIALFVLTTLGYAQNEERSLASFTGVKISSAFNVELIEAPSSTVKIEGVPEQYIDNIITEVNGDVLEVFVKGKVKAVSDMKLTITYQSLNSVEVSGASSVKANNAINASTFTIKTSGASNLDLSLNAQDVKLNSSGASDVRLKGFAKTFDLAVSGASTIKTKAFEVNKVDINISGASDVDVYAAEEISGTASGASDVDVYGNPPVNTISKSGASDVSTSTGGLNISVNNDDNVNVLVGNTGVRVSNDESVNVNTSNKNVSVVNDTTRVKWGGTQILIIDDNVSIKKTPKKRRNHWAGIDLGINGFVNSSGSFDLKNSPDLETTNPKEVTQFMELDYAKSWKLGINFFEYFLKLKEHHVGLVTGLGLEYNNYELRNNVRLIANGGAFVNSTVTLFNEQYTWGIADTTLNYSKNRFKTFYITAPFLFEINTGQHKNKSFHVSTGAILGYKFKTKMKYKYEEDGDTQKYKDNQNFNTNPFKVDLTARVGYGWFTAFATYSLTPLFEKNRGPELHAFSVGLALVGF
ncbi:MAG: DUF2807 domain-containing protein [Flavobacteriales bacterium]|nr:DUF2807 domain-containing protein [Flavobacteriales bacterium]